jgi:hypothetical protein
MTVLGAALRAGTSDSARAYVAAVREQARQCPRIRVDVSAAGVDVTMVLTQAVLPVRPVGDASVVLGYTLTFSDLDGVVRGKMAAFAQGSVAGSVTLVNTGEAKLGGFFTVVHAAVRKLRDLERD